jgi:hypothetical protein
VLLLLPPHLPQCHDSITLLLLLMMLPLLLMLYMLS